MTGDPNAIGAAAAGPLPPAFSQRPISAPEPAGGDERPYPPFFPREESGPAPALATSAELGTAELGAAELEAAGPAAPAAVAEVPAPVAPAPSPVAVAPSAATALESPLPIPRQVPMSGPKGAAGFGGLPSEAIFLPDAAIPKRPTQPEEQAPEYHTPVDLHDPRRRPVSTSDLAVLVAARLELFARRLRERGSEGLAESFSGDALDLALAGLISGYVAGRRAV